MNQFMRENLIIYKCYLIFKGTLLTSFVLFFNNIYDTILLNGFLPLGIKSLLADFKEIMGFTVVLLIIFKLILEIRNINKKK